MQDHVQSLEEVATTIGSLAPAFHALDELAARFGFAEPSGGFVDPYNVDAPAPTSLAEAIILNRRRMLVERCKADCEAAKRRLSR